MIRPQSAPRAMWRRANSAIISAGAIASTENCWVQPAAVTGFSDRPRRSVSAAANESASQPVALLTRMSTGPRCCSARSNRSAAVAGSDRSASIAMARPPEELTSPKIEPALLIRFS